MKLYGIKTCGSVRKAMDFLDSKHIAYTFIDFKNTPPSKEQIQRWAQEVGVSTLLNTKGMTYKKLGLSKQNLSDEQKIQNMYMYPLLIKRPVIETSKGIVVGFDEVLYAQFLAGR